MPSPSTLLSLLLLLGAAAAAPALPTRDVACSAQHQHSSTHGCSAFCGFAPLNAGGDHICVPSGAPADFPFVISPDDRAEYCEMVAAGHGCDDVCGFKWDPAVRECRDAAHRSAPASPTTANIAEVAAAGATASPTAAPIIGGQGKFRYQYMPDLLQAPAGASLVNCHGLVTDKVRREVKRRVYYCAVRGAVLWCCAVKRGVLWCVW